MCVCVCLHVCVQACVCVRMNACVIVFVSNNFIYIALFHTEHAPSGFYIRNYTYVLVHVCDMVT